MAAGATPVASRRCDSSPSSATFRRDLAHMRCAKELSVPQQIVDQCGHVAGELSVVVRHREHAVSLRHVQIADRCCEPFEEIQSSPSRRAASAYIAVTRPSTMHPTLPRANCSTRSSVKRSVATAPASLVAITASKAWTRSESGTYGYAPLPSRSPPRPWYRAASHTNTGSGSGTLFP